MGAPIASVILIPVYGFIYDMTNSYRFVLLLMIGLLSVASLLHQCRLEIPLYPGRLSCYMEKQALNEQNQCNGNWGSFLPSFIFRSQIIKKPFTQLT